MLDSDAGWVVCDVGTVADPDVAAVDGLARLQLTFRRLGMDVGLRNASRELLDLIALLGLRDVLTVCVESGLETGGQAEEREQSLGVEEEADPDDPTSCCLDDLERPGVVPTSDAGFVLPEGG
jgi:hypothetical protein